MLRKLIVTAAFAMVLAPVIPGPAAFAGPDGCHGWDCGRRDHGGAPLPLLAGGLPWLVALGGGVVVARRLRRGGTETVAE